jgi:hypothetical protein
LTGRSVRRRFLLNNPAAWRSDFPGSPEHEPLWWLADCVLFEIYLAHLHVCGD